MNLFHSLLFTLYSYINVRDREYGEPAFNPL